MILLVLVFSTFFSVSCDDVTIIAIMSCHAFVTVMIPPLN